MSKKFLLQFPVRAIINPDVGCPLIISDSKSGDEFLPIFTDEDLCNKFLEIVGPEILTVGESINLTVLSFDSPKSFAEFLDSINPPLAFLSIDPSGPKRRGLILSVDDMLPQLRNADF